MLYNNPAVDSSEESEGEGSQVGGILGPLGTGESGSGSMGPPPPPAPQPADAATVVAGAAEAAAADADVQVAPSTPPVTAATTAAVRSVSPSGPQITPRGTLDPTVDDSWPVLPPPAKVPPTKQERDLVARAVASAVGQAAPVSAGQGAGGENPGSVNTGHAGIGVVRPSPNWAAVFTGKASPPPAPPPKAAPPSAFKMVVRGLKPIFAGDAPYWQSPCWESMHPRMQRIMVPCQSQLSHAKLDASCSFR